MNSWVCSVCGSNAGLRNMNDACEQPTADGSFCYGKVLYKEITEAELYVIKPEVKRDKDDDTTSI